MRYAPTVLGSFQRQIDHNLGPSSNPRWVSGVEPHPGSCPNLGPSSNPFHPGSNSDGLKKYQKQFPLLSKNNPPRRSLVLCLPLIWNLAQNLLYY